MLFELHFAKHPFALKFFLQHPQSLIDIVIVYMDLHVYQTAFLEVQNESSNAKIGGCQGRSCISAENKLGLFDGAIFAAFDNNLANAVAWRS